MYYTIWLPIRVSPSDFYTAIWYHARFPPSLPPTPRSQARAAPWPASRVPLSPPPPSLPSIPGRGLSPRALEPPSVLAPPPCGARRALAPPLLPWAGAPPALAPLLLPWAGAPPHPLPTPSQLPPLHLLQTHVVVVPCLPCARTGVGGQWWGSPHCRHRLGPCGCGGCGSRGSCRSGGPSPVA
jgi:hypothetical protein